MYKKLASMLIAGHVLLLTSCNSSDTDSKFLARMYVKPSPPSDNWIVVSDAKGTVLSFASVDQEGFIDLKGHSTDGTITITQCSFFKIPKQGSTDIRKYFGFSSIQGIPVGTVFDKFELSSSDIPSQTGNATLKVVDFTGATGTVGIFTDQFGHYAQFPGTTPQGNTFSLDFKLFSNPADLIGTGYKNGVPVYYSAKGVKPGDQLTISWNDFIPVKIIPGSSDYTSMSTVACPVNGSAQGYSLYGGYVDGFDHYRIDAFYTNYSGIPTEVGYEQLNYRSSGPIPNSISIPKHTYFKTPGSTSVENFSFEFTAPYTYQLGIFHGDNDDFTQTIDWNVYAPAGQKFVKLEMPTQIQRLFPEMNLELLKGGGVNLFQRLDGVSYLDAMLSRGKVMSTYEYFQYSF